jgi:hypothetical protein
MSNDLVVKNMPSLPSTIPSDHEMMVYQTMAEQAVSSKMYRGIGEKAGVMMIMLSARELGIPPMQALNGGINIIQGKVEISARMMSALIRKAGHSITVKELEATHCILIGKRADTGEIQSCSFSVQEAQLAGLVKPGGGWTKWPKDMCFARALSRLSRQLFSDVIGIGYVEGEISVQPTSPVYEEEFISTKPVKFVSDSWRREDELVIAPENDHINEQKYLEMFTYAEKDCAIEYLDAVRSHFGWSIDRTLQEFMKDKNKTIEKFKSWKEQNAKHCGRANTDKQES